MRALPPRVATLVRLVGLILIDWSIVSSAHPPGGSGRDLVVTILLVLCTASWLIWTVRTLQDPGGISTRSTGVDAELYVLAGAGGLLTAASPSSAASAFVFVAVVAAALRAELIRAAAVGAVGLCGLALGTILYTTSPLGLLAYGLGFSAAALAGSNSRQSVVRAEQAELLLAQTQRSHEEQLRAARLEESTRIARDIHDVLAHTLAGLAIQLEATSALLEQDADRASILQRVRRAHELAREGLQETRRAVGALRSGGGVSIEDAVGALVEDYRSSVGAPATLTLRGDQARLAGRAGEAVVRVVQEALTNAKKHAPGSEVSVLIELGTQPGEGVNVVVEDRFEGETPAPAAPGLAQSGGGFGLRGMRERAEELGGSLQAGRWEAGWRVDLRLPAEALLEPSQIPAGAA